MRYRPQFRAVSQASDWRGRGVGAALLTAALDLASRRDSIRIELDVHADNRVAIALYEKFGFVREGVQSDGALIDGRFVDVVLMARVGRAGRLMACGRGRYGSVVAEQ